MKGFKKLVLIFLAALILGVGGLFIYFFQTGNVGHSGKLYIPSKATYRQMLDSLSPFLENRTKFDLISRYKKLPQHVVPGRYTLIEGMTTRELVNLLRYGNQDNIKIKVGNYQTVEELAGKISPYLECDSTQILTALFAAPFAKGLDSNQVLSFFIPNTYNFYWATTGSQFVQKMESVYNQFWTPDRKALAQKLNLNQLQVMTLASIVQMESAQAEEQPKVAGVYLNRLKIGDKLRADPTVIFSIKKRDGFDKKIERVYYKDLAIASPFNTYQNYGLPPAPICMPNESAILAVLKPEDKGYLFFVADPNRPGYHIFTSNYAEHQKYAQQYRQWIDSLQRSRL